MPYYDLEKIREAAKLENIEYRGYRVRYKIADLGYNLHDVADCIANLTTSDFSKTINYDKDNQDDVYICTYMKKSGDNEVIDELYLKLSLKNNYLSINLGAFHLPRY